MASYTFQVFKGSSSGKIVKSECHRGELKADEVLVRITHAGLCATDLHFKNQDIVLGHEGVGVVEEVGSAVTTFKVGERAGWGYLHNSCLHCDECLSGNEIFCKERELYGTHDTHQGGFGSHAIWKVAFLFHIPDDIPSSHAAPLMCAGGTVFGAMEMHGVRPTERVGILGIGGLGHLAIQFAAKMGCEVAVFSGTPGKEAEAKAFGATEFHVTGGADALKNVIPIKHLYVTTSALPDWEKFTPLLANHAVIYPLTVTTDNFTSPCHAMLHKGLRIQGSFCSSRGIHVKMLRFAAQHKVGPIVQPFPLTVDGIEEAINKLESGGVRYRAVLVAESQPRYIVAS
ncbi:chaperonin 10-like protein [Melanogaster broomeanus]|nr:chaperonin 10-like protein [Melanogaster broomeanus]